MLNAADFGDLLLECIRLFRENTEVLAQYQRRFKYILVDEYQDTNVAQYLWLRLIAQQPVAVRTHSGAPLPVAGEVATRSEPGEGSAARPRAPHPDPLRRRGEGDAARPE